ncbi:hypothetical protein KDA82_32520, partial [Streptomyces daliensis]|nr:hypothetical protein [Streptomyces daliensis]
MAATRTCTVVGGGVEDEFAAWVGATGVVVARSRCPSWLSRDWGGGDADRGAAGFTGFAVFGDTAGVSNADLCCCRALSAAKASLTSGRGPIGWADVTLVRSAVVWYASRAWFDAVAALKCWSLPVYVADCCAGRSKRDGSEGAVRYQFSACSVVAFCGGGTAPLGCGPLGASCRGIDGYETEETASARCCVGAGRCGLL